MATEDLEQPDLETAASEPDEQTTSQEDPLAGDTDSQNALMNLYEKASAEDRFPRMVEVKDVSQQERYWSGRQYGWWSKEDQRWNLPNQIAAGYGGDADVEEMPRFEFVTNIYQARGLMMIAAISGAPPRVRFFPEDADDENDLETAEARTKMARLIQRWNPTQKLLQEEAYHAWTGGFIAWWVHYVADGEKYGIDDIETMKQGEQSLPSEITCPACGWSAPADEAEPPVPCPSCGNPLTEENISEEEPIPVPEQGETEQAARGREVIEVYGALNCKRPQHVNQQSEFHYFGLEKEVHYSKLRAAFPDAADQIKPGLNQGAEDVFERNARLAVAENTKLATQSGASQASLCTLVRCWFRPPAFWMIDNKDTRDKLLGKFPHGCRVEFTGKVYLMSAAQSMDDALVSCHAMPGRGQHRNAVGTCLMSVQDRINTFSNIATETYEYGIPITYRASDTYAQEANEDQRAAPGLEVEVALKPGDNLANRILTTRVDSVSPDMAQHANDLLGPVSDMLTGTYPSLTGAGGESGAPETVGQQSMQRDQAMGRMGIFYVNLKQAHADVLTIACRDLEANSTDSIKIPVLGDSGDFESESVDVTALEGEAEAYPEGDENFPELWNQQRATMMQIMDTPYGAQLAQEPDNAELFIRLIGIPDLKMPGIDSIRKQHKEIGDLTKIPQGNDMLAGIAPNVEVDSDDNHAIESATCAAWMNSEKGQKTKRENPLAWQAVKEHKAQHDQAIPPPPPPAKPSTEGVTSNVKDWPQEAQAQWLEKTQGIQTTPQDFLAKVAIDRTIKTPLNNTSLNSGPQAGQPTPAAPPTGEPANPGLRPGV